MEQEHSDQIISPKPKVNRRPWVWNRAKIEAARMLAEDEATDKEISAKVGVSRTALADWKNIPEFAERMRVLRHTFEMRVMATGIANKANRVAFLDDLNKRQRKIIDARAESFKSAVGGESGLITINDKIVGWGEDQQTIQEQEFDTGFHREIRATLAQAADETGQSVSRSEISGPDGGPIQLRINVFDDIVGRVRAAKLKRKEEGG